MPRSTVTSKGQVTIPKPIRDSMGLQNGDQVDFVEESDGRIYVRRASLNVEDLRGLLRRPGRKPVSVEEMNRVIRDRKSRRP